MSAVLESEYLPVQIKIYDVPTETDITKLLPTGTPQEFPDVLTFQYYETLYDSFTTAYATVADSAGVMEQLFEGKGFRPLCPVEVVITDPLYGKGAQRSVAEYDFSGEKCFFLKRIVNQVVKGKLKTYTLELTTRDSLAAIATTIKRSWPADASTGIDYNTVVLNIMMDYIKTSKPTSLISEEISEQVSKVMGNNYEPYKLINDACKKATPKTASSAAQEEDRPSGYVFWETYNYGYNFKSIYNLITQTQEVGAEKTYKVAPVNEGSGLLNMAYNVISYAHSDSSKESDIIEQIITGARSSRQKYIHDPALNKVTLVTTATSSKIKDDSTAAPADTSFKPTTHLQESQFQLEYINSCEKSELNKKPLNPEHSSFNYGATLDTLRRNTSTIKIPGNLVLSAGDHVYVDFPLIAAQGTQTLPSSDKYSGYYLITKLMHYVEDITTIYTELEIVKLITTS